MATATASKIYIDKSNTGLLCLPQTDEAAETATRLLQRDLDVCSFYFFSSSLIFN